MLQDLLVVKPKNYAKKTHPVIQQLIHRTAIDKSNIDTEKNYSTKEVDKETLDLVTLEISDRFLKLVNHHFLSPISVSRNYAILKALGSKLAVNILGKCDGSGKYNILKKIESESAKLKEVSVFPVDVDICADNEQVL